jgi:DNA-binding CsgD family transcriptional regulator
MRIVRESGASQHKSQRVATNRRASSGIRESFRSWDGSLINYVVTIALWMQEGLQVSDRFPEQLRDRSVQLVIIGSAFFWSWLDAFFIGWFFGRDEPSKAYASTAIMLVFGSGIIIYALALLRPKLLEQLYTKGPLVALAVMAALGGGAMTLGNLISSMPLVVVGSAVAGFDLGVLIIGWGRCYAREGAHSASIEVAGAFAGALIIDLPILIMLWPYRVFVVALLPAISTAFFIVYLHREGADVSKARSGQAPDASSGSTRQPEDTKVLLVKWRRRLHYLPFTLLLACLMIMVAFGYMQYFASFSPLESGNNSILIQVTRGLSACVFFLGVLLFRWHPHILYRIGFILMITGYLLQPLFAQTPVGSTVFGLVTMVGYLCFDIFIWVVLSEIVYVYQRGSAGAIALTWLVRTAGILVGMLGCYVLFVADSMLLSLTVGTVVVSYLTVIAMAFLLGDGTGIWTIIKYGSLNPQPQETQSQVTAGKAGSPEADNNEADSNGDRLHSKIVEYGFTPRQIEIVKLILTGRSVARIAVELGISENTVVSHIRHIYHITEVNSRQNLIDVLMS